MSNKDSKEPDDELPVETEARPKEEKEDPEQDIAIFESLGVPKYEVMLARKALAHGLDMSMARVIRVPTARARMMSRAQELAYAQQDDLAERYSRERK